MKEKLNNLNKTYEDNYIKEAVEKLPLFLEKAAGKGYTIFCPLEIFPDRVRNKRISILLLEECRKFALENNLKLTEESNGYYFFTWKE